jgi:NhaP-type Na+/H+ or K+/H+ antiporter
MHQVVERLERLLTLIVLLLLGVSLTNGLLAHLTWPGVAVAAVLVLVLRPLAGMAALSVAPAECRVGGRELARRERLATAFFGVRGVGSLYYLAYATGAADFGSVDELWATVAFTVVLSVVVHGVAATPAMAWLDRVRDERRQGASAA